MTHDNVTDIVERGPEAFSRAIVHLQKELQQSLDDAATLRKQLENARSEALEEAEMAVRNLEREHEKQAESAEYADHRQQNWNYATGANLAANAIRALKGQPC